MTMMRNEHIISLIEASPVGALTLDEVSIIESHIAHCPECFKAYGAARIAGALVKARSPEAAEPSPFFKTRVMAALRENRAAPEPAALVRLWRAAGALASLMIVFVVALSALTFFAGKAEQPSTESAVVQTNELSLFSNNFSAEQMLFEDEPDVASDQMSDGQVLETVFAAEETDGN